MSKVVFGLCVPMFFLISGYLFFYQGFLTKELYFSKLKKRFITIFIPFVIWNLFYALIYGLGGGLIKSGDDGAILGCVPWINGSNGSLIKVIYHWIMGLFVDFNGSSGPIDVPFWYLRDLICMFVLSPLVYWFMKFTKQLGFALMILAWVATGPYAVFPLPYLIIPIRPAVLFFVMGSYFALRGKNMVEELTKVGSWVYWLYGIVAVLDLLTKDIAYNCYLHRVTILIGIIVVFKLGLKAVRHLAKKPETLLINKVRETNFLIYAFHWILLYWLSIPLSMLAGQRTGVVLLFVYFIQIFLCCIICIGLGLLLNRFCPKLMKIMNGR